MSLRFETRTPSIPNFALFDTPVKIGEGWAKCPSEFLVRGQAPTTDILLTGRRWTVSEKKNTRAKHKGI